jgi:hypothetical protein
MTACGREFPLTEKQSSMTPLSVLDPVIKPCNPPADAIDVGHLAAWILKWITI